MPQLNPRQLEAFRMVMLQGAVTTAAEFLGKSQPAVSRLIRDLEAQLGVELFRRHGNHLVPTPEADLFLAEIERHYVGLQALQTFAEDLVGSRRGVLEVAALPAMAMHYLPPMIARFLDDRVLSRVHLKGMPSHLVIEAVASGKAEIGIAAAPPERPGLRIENLEVNAIVVMPKTHRLARRKRLTHMDLVGEKLVALSEPTIYATPLPEALTQAMRMAPTQTPLSGIACQFVAAGRGIALIDPFAYAGLAEKTLTARQLTPHIPVRISIVSNASRPLSAVAREFVAALKKDVDATLKRLGI